MRAVVHADDAAKLSMIGPLVGDRNERHIFAFGDATERGTTKGENQLVGQGGKFVGLDEEIQIVARNIETGAGKRRVKMPIVGLFVILRIPTNRCDGQSRCFEPLLGEKGFDFCHIGVIGLLDIAAGHGLDHRGSAFQRTFERHLSVRSDLARKPHFLQARLEQHRLPFPSL